MRGRAPWRSNGMDDPWLRLLLAMVERARKDAAGIGLTQEEDPAAVQAEARAWLDELINELTVI